MYFIKSQKAVNSPDSNTSTIWSDICRRESLKTKGGGGGGYYQITHGLNNFPTMYLLKRSLEYPNISVVK